MRFLNSKHAKGWLALALFFILAGGLGWFLLGPGPGAKEDRIVFIAPKSGTQSISNKLAEAGVIHSALAFRVYAVATGQARKLKAGEYAFPPGCALPRVVRKLATGDVLQYPFTIPEGFTAAQIAERLAEKGLAAQADFLQVVQNQDWARAWKVPGTTLEGFLFPDTYDLTKGMTAEQIAKHMVDRFHAKVGPELMAAGQAQGLDLLKLMTLASIIEREVRASQERELVASVFYNRLHAQQRLESCATVLYAEGRVAGTLSLEDLETASPYNTYRHAGLPPGPICNPGLSAVHAAAYPAKTEYLFFVVRPDGTHVFSKTFEEHKLAKWRQRKARQRPTDESVAGQP